MSGRGRGRGGGGRGQPRRDNPPPPQSSGLGGGRGRGTGAPSGYNVRPAPAAAPAPVQRPPDVASSSSSSLSRNLQQLSLDTPAPAPAPAPAPTVQPPVQVPAVQSPVQASQAGQRLVQTPPSSSKALRFPNRPGYGTIGRKCTVRANHFLVEVADRDLHHYDVSISPEVTSKKVCREIVNTLVQLYRESHLGKRQLAYDGRKGVYTAGPLPFSSKDFVVKLVDKDGARREREFRVSIKFAAQVDLHHLRQFLQSRQLDAPQETIQALDVVLRATPSVKYQVVGRSFFSPVFECGQLDGGLQYWKGFYQSLRPTQMGLSLNIDMSARAFFEPILVSEFVSKYFNKDLNRPLTDQDRVKVKRALKGLRVQLYNRENVKRYKITGVTNQPICELKFPLDESGTQMSVMQYYRQKYDIVIKHKYLPALNAGSDAKPVYLPMEVYRIVEGQRYTKKLNDRQVTALLRATCQRPHQREATIKQMVASNDYNNDKVVSDFGINVRKELMTVDARVLPPPTLKYHETGRESRVDPHVGQWNMINKKMVNGGTVDFWTFVNFSRNRPDMVDQFCQELASMCASKGMVFNKPPVLPVYSVDPRHIEKVLYDINEQCKAQWKSMGHADKQLQLLIVILPEVSGSYGRIKRICETELGIVSQCCQPKHVSRLSMQYLENVSLKINVKAGGRNTVLVNAVERRIPLVSDRPTIIIGADVTHPSPGEDSSPSIAAVVASMDWPEITKYRALVSAQNHREEIIQDLYKREEDAQKGVTHRGMIRELLIAFRRSTGHKPHRIIFYRDGVSEGQFNQVLLYEMDAIRKACVSLEENYVPPVTFVVVQKRHHTRLFPANADRNNTDRSGNILPGTIVDRSICHPTEFDFYLCSHAGIQGTSRPTHYHVLYDENKFTADALHMLTYSLCFTFARCTRSVSIVPPAYYAHLAAFRARYYIEGEMSDNESSGGRPTRERTAEVRPLPVIKENVKDVMFYC